MGGGFNWPQSNGFTQIDERRTLSPALRGTFLPHRAQVLEDFINDQCSSTHAAARKEAEVDGSMTVGGRPVGAPE